MTLKSSTTVLCRLLRYAIRPSGWDGRLHQVFGVGRLTRGEVAAAALANLARKGSGTIFEGWGWEEVDIDEVLGDDDVREEVP